MKKNGNTSAPSSGIDLDEADLTALNYLDDKGGTGNQGPEPPPPGVGSPSGAPTPTPQALTYAGHGASLCNEFFLRRFGPDKGLSPQLLGAIQADLALAIDTYFPAIEAKPGLFALVAIGGHYFACQTEAKASGKQSASSAKVEAEKPPCSSPLSPEASGS